MTYRILKAVVDEAGNQGFVEDGLFIGSADDVAALIEQLQASDGIPRQADCPIPGGVTVIGDI